MEWLCWGRSGSVAYLELFEGVVGSTWWLLQELGGCSELVVSSHGALVLQSSQSRFLVRAMTEL